MGHLPLPRSVVLARRGPGGLDVGAHADRIVLRIHQSTLSADFFPHGSLEGLV